MNKENRMERISVQLPKDLLEDAKVLAKSNGMSLASLLRYLLIKEIQRISTTTDNE